MKNVSFICPVCGGELARGEKSYICPLGHCFDIARQGYVNLLTGCSGARHGDDRLMVAARAEFLDGGWYDPLCAAVADRAAGLAADGAVIVDAGCGEGKYDLAILDALAARGKRAQLIGVDISKDALILAARRSGAFTLAVASSAALPLRDGCADMLVNIFSPFIPGEFRRVLRPGGTLIRVYPLERHLWELKALIYDTPYENPAADMAAEGFRIADRRRIAYRIGLKSNGDIMRLFKMTPYYYKTGRADQAKAERAEALDVGLEFGMTIYEKEEQ